MWDENSKEEYSEQYKEEIQEVIHELMEFVKTNVGEEYAKTIKIMENDGGIILTTTVKSCEMTDYPLIIVFSYTQGMAYYFLSADRPKNIPDNKMYKMVNDLNIKYKISNTSFMVVDDKIVMKFIDEVTHFSSIIYAMQALISIADAELF